MHLTKDQKIIKSNLSSQLALFPDLPEQKLILILKTIKQLINP